MRRVLSLLVVAALAGAGVWAYLYTQSIGNAPKYKLARVEQGPLTAAVSATGNLNAVITVQVGSQVSGQIKALFVDFNSIVKKGQVVAQTWLPTWTVMTALRLQPGFGADQGALRRLQLDREEGAGRRAHRPAPSSRSS